MLFGIGDPTTSIGNVFWWEGWGIFPSIQLSLPFGKTEENPYLQAQESQAHQHIQMGTGSVIPALNISFFYDNIHWGILSSINKSLPFYANTYEYKPGSSTDWSIGYWQKFNPTFTLMGQLRGMHTAPERWMDLPYSGSDSIALNLSTFLRISPEYEIGLQLEKNLWIQNRLHAEEEPLNPILTWNLSFTH